MPTWVVPIGVACSPTSIKFPWPCCCVRGGKVAGSPFRSPMMSMGPWGWSCMSQKMASSIVLVRLAASLLWLAPVHPYMLYMRMVTCGAKSRAYSCTLPFPFIWRSCCPVGFGVKMDCPSLLCAQMPPVCCSFSRSSWEKWELHGFINFLLC